MIPEILPPNNGETLDDYIKRMIEFYKDEYSEKLIIKSAKVRYK